MIILNFKITICKDVEKRSIWSDIWTGLRNPQFSEYQLFI